MALPVFITSCKLSSRIYCSLQVAIYNCTSETAFLFYINNEMLKRTFYSRVCQQFVQWKFKVESLAILSSCAISRALEPSAEQFPKTNIDQDFVSSSGWWLLLVKIWVLPYYTDYPYFLLFSLLFSHQLYYKAFS